MSWLNACNDPCETGGSRMTIASQGLCHQCHLSVPEGALFCPECGAPQLRVRREDPTPEAGETAPLSRHAGGVAWAAALRASALFAVPAGLLLTLRDARGPLEILWVAAAAYLALRVYRRWLPGAPRLTPKLGGRIGLLVGLLAAVVNLFAEAAWLLVQRYLLHGGAAIDERWHSLAQLEVQVMQSTDPATAAQLGWLSNFWLSPEGTGTLLLLSLFASTLFVLFFGWLAGRLATRYAMGLRRQAS